MKHILFFIFAFCISGLLYGQTQQGLVRTAGTATKKGVPLAEVTVRSAGGSPVLSDKDGQFYLSLPCVNHEGDLFQITSVRKSGYELLDKDGLRTRFVYSKTVSIEIVMISTEELLRTKQDIEERARNNAAKNYEQKVQDLKQQLENQSITLQEYSRKIKELEDKMETFESLVSAMAEHYARTDYDKLDSLNAVINQCIAEGRLEEADSLINTKGDVVQRATDNMQKGRRLGEAQAQLDSIRQRVNANTRALEEEKRRIDIWRRQDKRCAIHVEQDPCDKS